MSPAAKGRFDRRFDMESLSVPSRLRVPAVVAHPGDETSWTGSESAADLSGGPR